MMSKQPLTQWVQEIAFWGVKPQTRETDRSFLSGTEFKKCRTSGTKCMIYDVNIIKIYEYSDKWLIS
jgi:hypothetical protein